MSGIFSIKNVAPLLLASIGGIFMGQELESGNHIDSLKSVIHAKFSRGVQIAGNSYAGFEEDACLTWAYHTCASDTNFTKTTTAGTHNNNSSSEVNVSEDTKSINTTTTETHNNNSSSEVNVSADTKSINTTIVVGNLSYSLEIWGMKIIEVDTYFTDFTKPFYEAIEIAKDQFRGCVNDPTCWAHVVVIFDSVVALAMQVLLQYAFSCAMYWFNKARKCLFPNTSQTTKTVSVNETSWTSRFCEIFLSCARILLYMGLNWVLHQVGLKDAIFIAVATQVCYWVVLIVWHFARFCFSSRAKVPTNTPVTETPKTMKPELVIRHSVHRKPLLTANGSIVTSTPRDGELW